MNGVQNGNELYWVWLSVYVICGLIVWVMSVNLRRRIVPRVKDEFCYIPLGFQIVGHVCVFLLWWLELFWMFADHIRDRGPWRYERRL